MSCLFVNESEARAANQKKQGKKKYTRVLNKKSIGKDSKSNYYHSLILRVGPKSGACH